MKTEDNLSAKEKRIIKEIVSNPNIVICPAGKEKAIVIEDRDTYLSKMCNNKSTNETTCWTIEGQAT